jgi:hypothetical protein
MCIFHLILEDNRLTFYAGELEVRPPLAGNKRLPEIGNPVRQDA